MPEPEDMPIDPMSDPDCCYYDVETNTFYKLEYDEHFEPKNFNVSEDGIITFIGNKEDYAIQRGDGTIVVNHQDYTNTIVENPSPEPVSEEKKKRGRPKKNP